MKKEKTKALATTLDSKNILLSPASLTNQIEAEQGRRNLLTTFIKNNLVDGKDYGTIQIGGRKSKPCLFKAGAEKFTSLLQLRAKFKTDTETLAMLGNPAGLVAYICELEFIPTGSIITEGRGACSLQEKGNANTTIKIAEKRAKIDAVLSLGLSDTFTQDLDDMAEEPIKTTQAQPKTTQPNKPVDTKAPNANHAKIEQDKALEKCLAYIAGVKKLDELVEFLRKFNNSGFYDEKIKAEINEMADAKLAELQGGCQGTDKSAIIESEAGEITDDDIKAIDEPAQPKQYTIKNGNGKRDYIKEMEDKGLIRKGLPKNN